MKLLLLGDTHGNFDNIDKMFSRAVREECDGIVQVGDFGFWTHTQKGQLFKDYVAAKTSESGVFFWWLDGNHDNFQNLYDEVLYPLDDLGFRPMNPRSLWGDKEFPVHHPFVHIPRGTLWEWDGVTFCAFGGAYSVDKPYRREGISWWPQETITEAELIRFGASRPHKVDVFLSHDCPPGVEELEDLLSHHTNPFAGMVFPESDANRERLKVAVDLVQPKILVHGHYHRGYKGVYTGPYGRTAVYGLGYDLSSRQSKVFDTSIYPLGEP